MHVPSCTVGPIPTDLILSNIWGDGIMHCGPWTTNAMYSCKLGDLKAMPLALMNHDCDMVQGSRDWVVLVSIIHPGKHQTTRSAYWICPDKNQPTRSVDQPWWFEGPPFHPSHHRATPHAKPYFAGTWAGADVVHPAGNFGKATPTHQPVTSCR